MIARRRWGQDPVDRAAGDPPGDPGARLTGPAGPGWRSGHLRTAWWYADNPLLLLGAIVAERVVGAVRSRRGRG